MKAVKVSSIYLCFFIIRPHTLISVGKKKSKQSLSIGEIRHGFRVQTIQLKLPPHKENKRFQRTCSPPDTGIASHNCYTRFIWFHFSAVTCWLRNFGGPRRCVCFCVLCRAEKVFSPCHILINFGFKEQGQKLKDHPLLSSHLITSQPYVY